MNRFRLFFCLISLGLTLVAWPAAVHACPSCAETIASNSSTGDGAPAGSMAGGIGGSMAEGFYYSILFMITVFLSLAGTIIYVIWRQAQADAQVLAADPARFQ